MRAARYLETNTMVSEDLIDETILKLAHKAGVGKLIAPMEVAVAIVGSWFFDETSNFFRCF